MMAGDSCYYKLSLSNVDTENENDSSVSTASHMNLLLEKELDLHDQIYMRSLSAEICLEDVTLTNLPSTFSDDGFINVQLTFPNDKTHGNAILNDEGNGARNLNPCKIPTKTLVTPNPKVAVSHVNSLIRSYTNKYVCLRYAELICDEKLFQDGNLLTAQKENFSNDDLSLLRWYLGVAVVTRMQLVAVINNLLSKEVMPKKPDMGKLPTFTRTSETSALESSTVFRSMATRPRVNHRLVHFNDFYSVDLTDVSSVLETLVTKTNDYLIQMGFVTRIKSLLTNDSINALNLIRDNNFELLELTSVLYKVLKLEETKQKSSMNVGLSEFYHDEILQLSLDQIGKCVFETNPDLFLSENGPSCAFTFDNLTSRVLGAYCLEGDQLVIGPLQHTSVKVSTDTSRNVLKRNRVINNLDRLYSRVRTLPRKLFFLSDIVSNDCHYSSSWNTPSAFSSYQVLATFFLDESDVKTGSVAKISNPRRFYRVKQAQNVLRNLNLVIVDESFQPLSFSAKTYCFFSLCLRPAENNM